MAFPLAAPADLPAILQRLAEAGGEPTPVALGGPRGGPRPEHVLASLLDLPGTVRLSECTEALAGRRDAAAVPRSALAARAAQMRHHVAARLGVMRRRVLRAYDAPLGGDGGLPDAEAMFALLVERDALRDRSERRLRPIARALGAPFAELFARTTDAAHREAVWLRFDVADELRILGGEAARVELLDAVLLRATQTREARLLDAVRARVDASFQEAFVSAVRALPRGEEAPPSAAELAPWFARGGFVRAHLDDCRQLALALVQHDCAAVQGLVDGACAAMNTEDPP